MQHLKEYITKFEVAINYLREFNQSNFKSIILILIKIGFQTFDS